MGKVSNAVNWMLSVAKNDLHGYDQANRWGPDYDCSSMIISAWESAGVPVKTNGATYTGNMKSVFLATGFKDVTSQVNRATGAGLLAGDVLLHESDHTEMAIGSGKIVGARANENGTVTGGQTGDQTGNEIRIRNYYNYPWQCILRWPEAELPPVTKDQTYSRNGYLTMDEMKVNAQYIAQVLLGAGWTLNAIAGVLGNMETESTINPGIWENLDPSQPETLGRGLVGWTPASRVNAWASERGLDPADMDTQLSMLKWEVTAGGVYYPTTAYPVPATFEAFTQSTLDPNTLGMVFLHNYERPYTTDQPNRGTQAEFWYEYLSGIAIDPGGQEKKKKRMSLLLMYMATRR